MKKYENLIGQKFGALLPIELSSSQVDSNGTTKLWKCKCDCGNIVYKSARHLKYAKNNNLNISCGCLSYKDLTGQCFGDYKVLQYSHSDKINRYWLCQCICGDMEIKSSNYLRTCSYKCLKIQKEKTKFFARIRNVINLIKERCYNKKIDCYKYYGGRGIKVCDEWLSNSNDFIQWALDNGYKEGLEIDRIDVNGNYCPENCRWVDKYVQANNKRNNIKIEYNGELKNLREWCRYLGLPYRKTHKRLCMYKWSVEKCFDEKERVGFI